MREGDTEGCTARGSTERKRPEQASPWRQQVGLWLQGTVARRGEVTGDVDRVSLGAMIEHVLDLDTADGCTMLGTC